MRYFRYPARVVAGSFYSRPEASYVHRRDRDVGTSYATVSELLTTYFIQQQRSNEYNGPCACHNTGATRLVGPQGCSYMGQPAVSLIYHY